MTTLKEIAEAAGVSPMTASYVLNRPERVRDETRRRVLEVMRRMNYHPRAAARALRSGRTRTIAYAVALAPGAAAFYQDYGVIGGLAERLDGDGYHLLVKVSHSPETLADQLDAAATAFDAVVLWGREEETVIVAEHLAQSQIPFVVKGRHEVEHPEWPQVDFDHEGLMAGAFGWLTGQGHRRIAYLGYSLPDAFVRCLRRGVDAAIVAHGCAEDLGFRSGAGGLTVSAEAQMTAWLTMPPELRPTALVIGAQDAAWHGVERALFRHGLRIGGGGGEFPVVGISSPNLALLQGRALAFQDLGVSHLIEPLHGLLRDLMAGTISDPIRRVGGTLEVVSGDG